MIYQDNIRIDPRSVLECHLKKYTYIQKKHSDLHPYVRDDNDHRRTMQQQLPDTVTVRKLDPDKRIPGVEKLSIVES